MTETQEITQGEKHMSMFAQLVMSLSTSAMQHLGKMPNPSTQKMETNLEVAQSTIDMLDMLESKTKNNLVKEEEQILSEALTALKLTYVQVQAGNQASSPAPKPPSTEERPPRTPTEEEDQIAPERETSTPASEHQNQREEKRPKFHKKYD